MGVGGEGNEAELADVEIETTREFVHAKVNGGELKRGRHVNEAGAIWPRWAARKSATVVGARPVG